VTEIVVIAAIAQNGVIGQGAEIPWHIREDFRRFRKLTVGAPCIMGDVTFRSLPEAYRPLPGRENVVLTLDTTYRPEGVTVFGDFYESISYVRGLDSPKAFIIGGATIYRLGMPVADVLELTRIHRDYSGNTRFPLFYEEDWKLVSRKDSSGVDEKIQEVVSYTFLTYRRRDTSIRPPV
jgi:dihydrofolate reductase